MSGVCKIPVTLFTGFFGVGKTTAIKSLLANNDLIAVVLPTPKNPVKSVTGILQTPLIIQMHLIV